MLHDLARDSQEPPLCVSMSDHFSNDPPETTRIDYGQLQLSLWMAISDMSSGVDSLEHRVEDVQNGMTETESELTAMLKDARLLSRFLVREECAPNRCCFVSSVGQHRPHCGPCAVTKHYEFDTLMYNNHVLRMYLREEGGSNDDAIERWKVLSANIVSEAVRERCNLYLSERRRCMNQIIYLGESKLFGRSTPFVKCPLCVLEVAHGMPGGLPIVSPRRQRPYVVQLGRSYTFDNHLQHHHWRVGYTCAGCLRTFRTADSCGRHVSESKQNRCRGAAVLSLKASWLCLRRRVMRMCSANTERDLSRSTVQKNELVT